MRRRHASSTHSEGLGQPRGQVLVIVALGMLAMIAMAGLVTDAGLAWANRRQAQRQFAENDYFVITDLDCIVELVDDVNAADSRSGIQREIDLISA